MAVPEDDEDDTTSPLDDVFVDDTQINEERVAAILRAYANVGESTGRLQPTKKYDELTADGQVLVTLVAQQGRVLRGDIETAAIGPKEIAEMSGVKVGTVKPNVRSLVDDGLIEDGKEGYYVSPTTLPRVMEELDIDE